MRGREIGVAGELETTGLAPVSGDRDILDGWIGVSLSDSSRSVRSTPIPRSATVHHRVQSGNPCSPVGVSLAGHRSDEGAGRGPRRRQVCLRRLHQ